MKTIRLLFFFYILCCFNPLLAQDEIGNGFLFPTFEKGTVIFRNGSQIAASLNYSMLQQEMLFQDNNEIMALANTSEILAVKINERRFVPVSSKGIFYEEIPAGNGYYFIQHKAIMLSEGKAAAYGGYSQTSSTTSYGTYNSGSTGTLYKLKIDEKFRLKIDNFYYMQSGKSYKKFNSAKALGKLFKGQELKIEEFSKEQSISFSKIDDITKVVEYGFSLVKK